MASEGVVRYFPGEREAIAEVLRYGEQYGYGNLIMELKKAWAARLRADGISEQAAGFGGQLICVWCRTDCRTGKKVKREAAR